MVFSEPVWYLYNCFFQNSSAYEKKRLNGIELYTKSPALELNLSSLLIFFSSALTSDILYSKAQCSACAGILNTAPALTRGDYAFKIYIYEP